MNCPACGLTCNQETYEGVLIDVCPQCSGVWLDRGELDAITKKRDKAFRQNEIDAVSRLCGSSGVPKEEDSRDLPCPKCNKMPMKTFNYSYASGILADRCGEGCGVWLDPDELEKVQIFAELWQDKLEANRDRFTALAGRIENDQRDKIEAMDQAIAPSRFRLVNSLLIGLVRFT